MFLKSFFAVVAVSLFSIVPLTAFCQEIDCLKCHAKLKKEKTVHAAMEMGCVACHTGIEARTMPHKKTNKISKGLSAEQPDLCYGCHDKALFNKKNVHAAVGMGCTGCHSPHSSKNAKLLTAEAPGLCFNCHDKPNFSKKIVHSPVAAGMCLGCHTPHSSDQVALLIKKPYDLCLDCHSDTIKKPHAVTGFGAGRHPLGEPKKTKQGEEKELKDPSRPDRAFYCGSCHNPHSADGGRLFRFNAKSGMNLCTNCHKM